MLGELVNKWAPRAFAVSFKLETDQGILVHKVTDPGVRAVTTCRVLRRAVCGLLHRGRLTASAAGGRPRVSHCA